MKQIFLSILLLSLPLLTISVQTFLKKTIPHSISTMETRLLVKIYDKRDFTNSPNEFSTRTFIINPVLVYFFEREKKTRKISSSIPLNTLISPNDDVLSGKCCISLSSIHPFEDSSTKISDSYCFNLESRSEKWILCSKDLQILHNFRSFLIKSVIATSFSSLNTNNTNNILVNIDNSENCKTPYTNEWDYSFQNTWDCYCNIGLFQSPISLTLTPTPNSFPGFLSFKYIKSLINPVAIPKNSREIEIFGNFGDLIYHNPEKDTLILSSYKLAFKFPSEHKVNGKQFPLEIEIYHKNRVQEAVLSIFVLADKKGDSEINKFIEDIDSPTWNFDEKITIFSKPDLRNLGPENGDYMGSFFMYTGSDTSPPCRENIIRFVLKNPIRIPISQLKALKPKALKGGSNARVIKGSSALNRNNDDGNNYNNNDNVVVYYNKGKKILTKNEDISLEIQKKVKDQLNWNKRSFSPEKYIRVSSNISDYIKAPTNENDVITGEINKDLYVNYVKENEIPEKNRRNLFDLD